MSTPWVKSPKLSLDENDQKRMGDMMNNIKDLTLSGTKNGKTYFYAHRFFFSQVVVCWERADLWNSILFCVTKWPRDKKQCNWHSHRYLNRQTEIPAISNPLRFVAPRGAENIQNKGVSRISIARRKDQNIAFKEHKVWKITSVCQWRVISRFITHSEWNFVEMSFECFTHRMLKKSEECTY